MSERKGIRVSESKHNISFIVMTNAFTGFAFNSQSAFYFHANLINLYIQKRVLISNPALTSITFVFTHV